MDKRDIWELFVETGEPACWLLYRLSCDAAAQSGTERQDTPPNTCDKNA